MNFSKEFEEYSKLKYLSRLQIGNKVNTMTKEKKLDLECDIDKGIKVLKYNKVFENMEQLLNQYSKLFREKFEEDLSKKINQLTNQLQEEEDSEDY
ncbi:unnamed protein product [Paramecium sonneborni]|uniref:GSKIP domain-containing protein n=1 Tax=Paramecium sonneborni TaxID=65129 RepID=A0A8S1R1X7_9CILI|nr:unnamed protein product [Paramecium sonneborni]